MTQLLSTSTDHNFTFHILAKGMLQLYGLGSTLPIQPYGSKLRPRLFSLKFEVTDA